ncbi:hypothetical protein [Poritiphilus flavus]|uniref:Uncharacterized protein n=1 Tax=Poritiphilus flavus TaxID=2697053 RepID=A0A6L9EBG8_9FLAO|nr:hypothetical protein [Poritiphilus flavus]NAS11759.1 hypothetical protein [Poritiphilus flavus]
MTNRKQSLRPTSLEHAAKVQLYRWYQLFERDYDVENSHQLEILDNDVIIKSFRGEIRGRKNFPKELVQSANEVRAHHVQNIQFQRVTNGPAALDAEVTYQRLQPDGAEKSYSVRYKTELSQEKDLLPKFTLLDFSAKDAVQQLPFQDAYPSNRTKALVHYWLLLIERAEEDKKVFRDILAESFMMDLGNGDFITSVEDLQAWISSTYTQLKMSCHYPENFSVQSIQKNKYEVYVDLVWQRLTSRDLHLKTVTRYRWIVQDDPNDRFARIQWISEVNKKKDEVLI